MFLDLVDWIGDGSQSIGYVLIRPVVCLDPNRTLASRADLRRHLILVGNVSLAGCLRVILVLVAGTDPETLELVV